jgi:hypothetical protein
MKSGTLSRLVSTKVASCSSRIQYDPSLGRTNPVCTAVEPRRIVELILCNSDPITAERGIVLEARLRHGEVVFAHSEEAAK